MNKKRVLEKTVCIVFIVILGIMLIIDAIVKS